MIKTQQELRAKVLAVLADGPLSAGELVEAVGAVERERGGRLRVNAMVQQLRFEGLVVSQMRNNGYGETYTYRLKGGE